MLTREQIKAVQDEALQYLDKAAIKLTQKEIDNIEAADFGFGIDELRRTGLELVVYENNDRYCAKEMILFPGQTCPEHRHPPVASDPGKKKPSVAAGARFTSMLMGRRPNLSGPRSPKEARTITRFLMKSSWSRETSIQLIPERSTGSSPVRKELSCLNSPQPAGMKQTFSQIPGSNGYLK